MVVGGPARNHCGRHRLSVIGRGGSAASKRDFDHDTPSEDLTHPDVAGRTWVSSDDGRGSAGSDVPAPRQGRARRDSASSVASSVAPRRHFAKAISGVTPCPETPSHPQKWTLEWPALRPPQVASVERVGMLCTVSKRKLPSVLPPLTHSSPSQLLVGISRTTGSPAGRPLGRDSSNFCSSKTASASPKKCDR